MNSPAPASPLLGEEGSQDEARLTGAGPGFEVDLTNTEGFCCVVVGLCVEKQALLSSYRIFCFWHLAYRGEGVSGEEERHLGSYRRGGDGGEEGIIQSGCTSFCGSAILAMCVSPVGDQEDVQAGRDSVSALEEASLKSEKVEEGTGDASASDSV